VAADKMRGFLDHTANVDSLIYAFETTHGRVVTMQRAFRRHFTSIKERVEQMSDFWWDKEAIILHTFFTKKKGAKKEEK
jgi:deferrochelatase/peroxidase EfeB